MVRVSVIAGCLGYGLLYQVPNVAGYNDVTIFAGVPAFGINCLQRPKQLRCGCYKAGVVFVIRSVNDYAIDVKIVIG